MHSGESFDWTHLIGSNSKLSLLLLLDVILLLLLLGCSLLLDRGLLLLDWQHLLPTFGCAEAAKLGDNEIGGKQNLLKLHLLKLV
jgi:hypothetical protein